MLRTLFISLLCLLGTTRALAWGQKGHDVVAYIAECNLTPKAKKTIEKILGHSIVYYATWMDEWRAEPGYEHTRRATRRSMPTPRPGIMPMSMKVSLTRP